MVPVRCKDLESQDDFETWLLVTRNCAEALRVLRLQDNVRVVWVDAICINQKNSVERTAQVRIMDSIYSKAASVIVFLSILDMPTKMDEGIINKNFADDIFFHPYFSRIWIIQEIFMARKAVLYFGDRSYQWSDLVKRFKGASKQSPELLFSQAHFVLSISNRKKKRKLLDLMRQTRHFQATDPRDKVIALLPLAKDVTHYCQLLLVDYRIPLKVLLRRLAAIILLRRLGFYRQITRTVGSLMMEDKILVIDELMNLSATELAESVHKVVGGRAAKEQRVFQIRLQSKQFTFQELLDNIQFSKWIAKELPTAKEASQNFRP